MPNQSEPDLPVCRCLKTKMLYVLGPEAVDLSVPSSTAQYWCVHTMRQVGPDDGLVAPDHCVVGRPCFEPRE
ncbi:MAG TPA: hypothetical protein VKN99_13705 [Polyangia bacterium]|nr:hypothetical protein [Polyangia bacterium]